MGTKVEYYPASLRNRFAPSWFETKPGVSDTPSAGISWIPDVEKHEERKRIYEAGPKPDDSLPDGWPTLLQGPLVWNSEQITMDSSYIYELSDADIKELQDALSHIKGKRIAQHRIYIYI